MISVIIPAYNAQAYLRECLESVLAQSFTDWEAIVINDGSTDATLDIAADYSARDPRIRVITTENRGVSAARNTGLDAARGDWTTFLDSDDMLAPAALEAYMQHAHSLGDIIAGQWCDSADGINSKQSRSETRLGASAALAGGLYQTGVSSIVGAKAYRRTIYDKVRFQEDIRYEDLVFFCQAMLEAKAVTEICDVVYIYRDNPDSFIHTFTPSRLDVLTATERIERMCAHDHCLLAAARDRRLSASFNIFGLLSVHDREGRYADVKRRCWQLIKGYRCASLRNPKVRLKNKLGILVSYAGQGALSFFSRLVY